MSVVLELRFPSADAYAAGLAASLQKGRAFIPGAGRLDIFMPVKLLVIEPSGCRRLEAVVVMAPEQQAEQGGVGLMLEGEWKSVLAAPAEALPEQSEPETQTERLDVSPQLRLKRLSSVEQIRLARTSAKIQERMLLERMLGKQVWEALLGNARITVPEVAKIARKGTVPRPLVERIVDHRRWIRAPQIRRALLSNPKLPRDGVMKILRATPKHELKLIAMGTAYPMAIRDAVRRILGGKR